jgi:hypothetical protein
MIKAVQEFFEGQGIDTKIYLRDNMDGSFNVVRMDPMTAEYKEVRMEFTKDQFNSWNTGELIQNALGHLDENEREFLISGVHRE